MKFDARREYLKELDIRDHTEFIELVSQQPDRSVLYPIVAARRAGKTWTLIGLKHKLNQSHGEGRAAYFNLATNKRLPNTDAKWILLDEPQLSQEGHFKRDIKALISWCKRQKKRGATIVLAMSPAEWLALRNDSPHAVSDQDLRFLPPLTTEQANQLARTARATELLSRLDKSWQRTPFLLELVFQTDDEFTSIDGDDLQDLLWRVDERSDDSEFYYFKAIYNLGLTESQRNALQTIASSGQQLSHETELLERCHLIEQTGKHLTIADPILASHLYPLRIHHVSDIHFGPKAAQRVDLKDSKHVSSNISNAFGPKGVADAYTGHLRELVKSGKSPHLLVISGDVAEWATSDQYAHACDWLNQVRLLLAHHPRLGRHDANILLVPGNHDVSWDSTEGLAGFRKRHLPFARAFDSFPRAIRTRLEEPPETRDLSFVRYPQLGVEIVLLGSAEFGGDEDHDPVRDELLALIDRLRHRAMEAPETERASVLQKTVSRIDPGIVHNKDLDRIRQTNWNQPVRIAVLHHPVSPLPSTELSRFSGLINAGEVKDTLVNQKFCLVLHGHAHTGWFGKEQWPERHDNRTIHIAAAPSLGSREVQEHNGFNEIEIAQSSIGETVCYRIIVRRVVREGATWAPKNKMEFEVNS